jgi:hypothetical protein
MIGVLGMHRIGCLGGCRNKACAEKEPEFADSFVKEYPTVADPLKAAPVNDQDRDKLYEVRTSCTNNVSRELRRHSSHLMA